MLICEDEAAALAAVKSIMDDRQFGASGSRIVIEEFLTWPEVSVLSFTDGKTVVPMVSSICLLYTSWDATTGAHLDKDLFRRDLGGEEEAYREVMKRLLGE